MRALWLLPSVFLFVAVSARAADKPPKKITYDDQVLPILREKCFTCHNQDRKSGGLRLNNYTNVKAGGSSGEIIKPGDPDGSLLYKLVTHQQEPHMPPKSGILAKESLDIIRAWIAGGALENAGSKAVVMNKPKYDIALSAIAKGKPAGPPPMPQKLNLEPMVRTSRANALTALAASPWAPVVAVAGQKQVVLYHTDTLELLGILPFPEGFVHVLKFSRNGRLLLAGGGHEGKSGKVVVWNIATGERIFAVGDEFDAILAADISADQTQIALGGPSKVIRVYSTKDGKLINEIKKHTDWIYAIEFSPDGVLLATGDRNGGLFVWEAHTGREYFSLRGHTAAITDVSWRADSNVLASSSEDATIRLWEMENGNQIKGWGAGAGVQSVKFSSDGRLLSCARDLLTRVWDGNGAQVRAFDPFPDVALRGVFSHDGGRVIAGDWSGQIRVWNAGDGKFLGQLLANPLTVAEQLQVAQNELNARQIAYTQLAAAAALSQAGAREAAAGLAAGQKAITDTAEAAKAATANLAKAKDAADRASAGLAAAQSEITAKQVLAQAFAEAAAKVKAAADKAKDNKELIAAVVKSQQISNQAVQELATAQKGLANLTGLIKTTTDQLAAAHQAVASASAASAAAPKQVEAKSAAAIAATGKAAADQAAVSAAAAALAAAKANLGKWQAASSMKQAKK